MATKTQVKSLMKANEFFTEGLDNSLATPLQWVQDELVKAKSAVAAIKGHPEAKARANVAISQCERDLDRMYDRLLKVGRYIGKEVDYAWEDHPEWEETF
jgi:hypothetical protein